MNNIARIQEKLIEKNLDAILITDEKNQRYAAGFPFTDGSVLVSREKAWLFTDSRYIEAAEKAASCCVCVQMFDKNVSQMDLIRAALKEAGVEKLGAEEEKLNYSGYQTFEKELAMPLLPAQAILSELRAIKTAEEIDSIVKAQRISEKALEAVLQIIKPGMTEKEVTAELVYQMLKNGSEGNAFDPIVVTGANTSLPHGVPGESVIKAGDFVTMDFGSLYNGYCSDMTRTIAVGHATDEMKTVYNTVLQAQLAGIAAAKAGVPGCDIDGAARKIIDDAGYGQYFGHGLGHSLGLDIHEAPNANPRNTLPMPAGAVITIEPGIYLPGRFGVRIEDMVAVEEGGCQLLTAAPKELIIL